MQILTLNKISSKGTDLLDKEKYTCSDAVENPDAVLVRSASMHEMDFPASLKSIARAGAGVNNIPLDKCTQEGIVVFNTPGANANAVKELVVCCFQYPRRECQCRKGTGGLWPPDGFPPHSRCH